MALPIKCTPVLTGKDSERFQKLIANPKPVSKERIEYIKSLTAKVLAKAKL